MTALGDIEAFELGSMSVTRIQNLIRPRVIPGQDARKTLEKAGLEDLGLWHPSSQYARYAIGVIGAPTIAALLLAVALLWGGHLSWGLVAVGFSVTGIGILVSAWVNILEFRLLRADVFVGWSFTTSVDPSNQLAFDRLRDDVSTFVLEVGAFLSPTWGVVCIMPPTPGTDFAVYRERTGARGSQWPFVLRVRPPSLAPSSEAPVPVDDAWKSAVRAIIEKCSVAIFDCRSDPTASMLWEISAAEAVLGSSRVCRVCPREGGGYSLCVDGATLTEWSPPANITPHVAGVVPFFSALGGLREWLASTVPVYEGDLAKRERAEAFGMFVRRHANLLIVGGVIVVLFGLGNLVVTAAG